MPYLQYHGLFIQFLFTYDLHQILPSDSLNKSTLFIRRNALAIAFLALQFIYTSTYGNSLAHHGRPKMLALIRADAAFEIRDKLVEQKTAKPNINIYFLLIVDTGRVGTHSRQQ